MLIIITNCKLTFTNIKIYDCFTTAFLLYLSVILINISFNNTVTYYTNNRILPWLRKSDVRQNIPVESETVHERLKCVYCGTHLDWNIEEHYGDVWIERNSLNYVLRVFYLSNYIFPFQMSKLIITYFYWKTCITWFIIVDFKARLNEWTSFGIFPFTPSSPPGTTWVLGIFLGYFWKWPRSIWHLLTAVSGMSGYCEISVISSSSNVL